jgi:hypothetical protein
MTLVGVEYIYEYLHKLNLENAFCKKFDENDIHQLLRGYDDNYQDLLINIFELVLINSLGSVLSNKEVLNLNIEQMDLDYLQQELSSLTKDKLDSLLLDTAGKICTELNISDKLLKNHILTTVRNQSVKIVNAMEIGRLDSIFISFKEPEMPPVFQFEDGKKMDDELFRCIVADIKDCSNVQDKIAIIQKEIHSITDLVDILECYCIFDNEFDEIYRSLGDMELALLFKKLSSPLLDSDYHLTENEKEWQNRFNCFFKEIDLTKRERIIDLAEKTNIQ